jgi:hypothetical protein
MIRDKEGFLPSHEKMLPLCEIPVGKVRSFGLFSQRTPGGESRPVVEIGLVRGAPFFIPGLEGVFRANDFSLEESG